MMAMRMRPMPEQAQQPSGVFVRMIVHIAVPVRLVVGRASRFVRMQRIAHLSDSLLGFWLYLMYNMYVSEHHVLFHFTG